MATDRAIRVMIVDDHAIVRNGIRLSLLAFDDLELVAEAKDCQETLAACDRLRDAEALPDVVVMDMMMPGMDGARATQAIKEQHPEIQILVLSSFSDDAQVQRVMQAGAVGYLLKDVPMDELAAGIRAVAAGETVMAPEAVQALVREAGPQAPQPGCDLTERQLEVLALLVEGLTNNEIAERLILSPYTVRNHVSEILSKLGTGSRTEAAALAVRLGLVG